MKHYNCLPAIAITTLFLLPLVPASALGQAVGPPASRQASAPSLNTVSGLKKLIAQITKRNAMRDPKNGIAASKSEKSKAHDQKSTASQVVARTSVPGSVNGPVPPKKGKTAGTGILKARLYYIHDRAYPRDAIDWSYYRRAVIARDNLPPARIGGGTGFSPLALGGVWEFMGPTNLTVPYQIYNGVGYVSGRVNAIAYDPVVTGTWYLGAAGGGIWKTTNSGATWTPLSDSWESLQVSSIAIDPNDHLRIFVGTGDFPANGGYGFGIMRSLDGGVTWTNVACPEMGAYSVNAILIDPEQPNIITAVAGEGKSIWGKVWRSVDGGDTWKVAIQTNARWNDLKMSECTINGIRYYYAAGVDSSSNSQVWRSADRGANWTSLNTLAVSPDFFLEIATSRTAPDTVYLISPGDKRVWRSDAKGDNGTWVNITGNIPGGYNWSQPYYDLNLTTSTRMVNGVPTDVLYAGLITISQSPSGLGDWQDLGVTYTDLANTHNDQHSMAIDPSNADRALVGNDGGIYGFTYNPGPNNWFFDTTLNGRLGITQFYHIAPHPSNPDIVIGGTQDNATPVSLGDLGNWTNRGGGDGGGVAINPLAPQHQYTTSQEFGRIFMTEDNWTNWVEHKTVGNSGDVLPFIGQIALDPSSPHLLYAGTNYLWRYNRLTGLWTPRLGNQMLSAGGTIRSIAVAPTDGNRIYTGSDQGELYMSTNAGLNWITIHGGVVSLPNRSITSIAVDPLNPSIITVGLGGTGTGHLWRCSNTLGAGRLTWTNRSGGGANRLPDVPVSDIALDLDDATKILYVATDVGVFATEDTGASWQNATKPLGLPNVQVNSLKAIQGTRLLVAGTYGRGIWRIGLPPKGVFKYFTLAPNPVDGGATSTGTVILNAPAPAGGLTFQLKSSNTGATTVPANFVIPAGNEVGSFTVTTVNAAVATHAIITVSYNTWNKQARLDINKTPIVPASVTAVPQSLTGGTASVGKVTLNAAPAVNTVVTLNSTNPAVASVPANVTVLAGKLFATFPITTFPVAGVTNVTIQGTCSAVTKSVVMTVNPPTLTSVALNPTTVTGGIGSTGTVVLTGKVAVGAGPLAVSLSSNSASAGVPLSVSVAEGASSATFAVTTTAVAAQTVATISASHNLVTKTAALTVIPPALFSVIVVPNSVTGGTGSTGTVKLTGNVAVGGGPVVVALSSNSTSVNVPVSVSVQVGAASATFAVTTIPVVVQAVATISATHNAVVKTAALTVNPPALLSVALNPNSVTGGAGSTGKASLTGAIAAGAQPIVVALTSNSASAGVPASVSVLAGASFATFAVTTSPVAVNTVAVITGTYGIAKTANLTIKPPAVATLTLNPTTVKGGNSSVATVTLTGNAPAGGSVVTLSSNNAAAQTPASVLIPAGLKTATFTVTTSAVGAQVKPVITATLVVAKTAALTINP